MTTIGFTFRQEFHRPEHQRTTVDALLRELERAFPRDTEIVALTPGASLPPGLDGLVLPGGDDLSPTVYGRSDLSHEVCESDEGFDLFELSLTQKALKAGLPVLAVCRGMQVLNVACGGTLYPRIDGHRLPKDRELRYDPEGRGRGVHSVRLASDSLLRELLGVEEATTNSIHTGAVDALGAGLRPVAWSEDGVVEALETTSDSWAVAVQFHPEDLVPNTPIWGSLFARYALVVKQRRTLAQGDEGRRGRPSHEGSTTAQGLSPPR